MYIYFLLGSRPYLNIGCFNDSLTEHSLPELLFDDQENIDLQNWDEWLDSLVCRCAEEANKASYTHFSIQALGQCYSGPKVGSTYFIHGTSDNCVTVGGKPNQDQFVQCDTSVLGKPCAGGNLTNYVYRLTDSKCNVNLIRNIYFQCIEFCLSRGSGKNCRSTDYSS